jgi:hypothetical protein
MNPISSLKVAIRFIATATKGEGMAMADAQAARHLGQRVCEALGVAPGQAA